MSRGSGRKSVGMSVARSNSDRRASLDGPVGNQLVTGPQFGDVPARMDRGRMHKLHGRLPGQVTREYPSKFVILLPIRPCSGVDHGGNTQVGRTGLAGARPGRRLQRPKQHTLALLGYHRRLHGIIYQFPGGGAGRRDMGETRQYPRRGAAGRIFRKEVRGSGRLRQD